MLRTVGWIAAVAAALYVALCLLAFLFQRRLMYFPARYPEDGAVRAAAQLGLSAWRDARGALVGWRASPGGALRARALVLHGNAGAALDRAPYAAALVGEGVEVLLLEYPGYGARPGAPTRAALGAAAAEALDLLAREGPSPIWLVGESLGSGVAARAIALRPGVVRGLVLVTPFARMSDVVKLHYPVLPSFLLLDRWAPEDDLARWTGPTYLLLAGRDEVVSLAQGQRLAEHLHGPRRVVVQAGASHGGLMLGPDQPLWGEVVAFLDGRGAR